MGSQHSFDSVKYKLRDCEFCGGIVEPWFATKNGRTMSKTEYDDKYSCNDDDCRFMAASQRTLSRRKDKRTRWLELAPSDCFFSPGIRGKYETQR